MRESILITAAIFCGLAAYSQPYNKMVVGSLVRPDTSQFRTKVFFDSSTYFNFLVGESTDKILGFDANGKMVAKEQSLTPEDTFVTRDRVIFMGQSNGGGTGDSVDLYDTIFLGQKFNYVDTMSRVLIANLVNGTYNPYLLGVNTIQYLPGEIGSDLFFAQRWMENTHQNKLLIHKRVRDGGAISLFQKGGSYYTDLMNIFDSADTKLAEQGYKARNVAWVWVQGESDKTSDSATYSAALYRLVDSLKEDSVIMPYTKMIIAGVSTGSKMYGAGVRAAQEAFVAANPLARFINTDSFTFEADTLHYDARGLANLGYTAYQYAFDADSKLPQNIKNEKLGSLIVGLGNQDATPDRAVVEMNAPTHFGDSVIIENELAELVPGSTVSALLLKPGADNFTGIMHDGADKFGVWFDGNGPYIWFSDNQVDGRNAVRVDRFGDIYVGRDIGSVIAQYESRARGTDTSTWHQFALADSAGNVTYLVKADGTANYYKRLKCHDNLVVNSTIKVENMPTVTTYDSMLVIEDGVIKRVLLANLQVATSAQINHTSGDYVKASFSGGNPQLELFNSGLSNGIIANNGTAITTNVAMSVGGAFTASTISSLTNGFISGIGGTAPQGSMILWSTTSPFIDFAKAGSAQWYQMGTDATTGDLIFKSDPSGFASFNGTTKLTIARTTGKLTLYNTVTPTGTTGDQTINRPTGSVNIAAAGTTVTVTNSSVVSTSLVFAELQTNDATAWIKNVVPTTGSFTVNLGAAATGEVKIAFWVIN